LSDALKIGAFEQGNRVWSVEPADHCSTPSAHANGAEQICDFLRGQVNGMCICCRSSGTWDGRIGLEADLDTLAFVEHPFVAQQLAGRERHGYQSE
jgi:hypothetical protein